MALLPSGPLVRGATPVLCRVHPHGDTAVSGLRAGLPSSLAPCPEGVLLVVHKGLLKSENLPQEWSGFPQDTGNLGGPWAGVQLSGFFFPEPSLLM